MLFNQFEREVIRWYYKEAENKSRFWKFNNRNIIVRNYEYVKSTRNFEKEIIKTPLFKFLERVSNFIYNE